MKKNTVVFILVTLVLVMFAMFALKNETKTVTSQQAGKMLFPDLERQVNDVTRIVNRKGDKTVTIEQKDGRWQIVEKDNFPANPGRVKQTILAVAGLSLFEAKTKKSENYKKLQVEDATQTGASSTLVTLEDGQQKTLASVILGKVKPGGQSAKPHQYVRIAGDEQAWLVTGSVQTDVNVNDWLDTDLVNLESKRISQITFTAPKATPFSVRKTKPADANFALVDSPKGKKLKSAAEANKLAGVLQNLKLTDASKADAVAFDSAKTSQTRYETFDGMIIRASAFENEDTTWLKLSAEFDATLRATDSSAGEGDTDKPAAPALKDAMAVQQEVSTLNARLEPWVFQVTDANINLIASKQADLLTDDSDSEK